MMRSLAASAIVALSAASYARAHIAAFAKGMYCENGLSNSTDENAWFPVTPLWNSSFDDWWMHGECKYYPPADGDFLEFPAGGNVTVELAGNRGQTTLSYNGTQTSDWPDGKQHPEYEDGSWPPNTCITSPNLHAFDETDAANTVFAISYTNDISQVTPENLVVFTVNEHSPFKRLTTYQVPAEMPACPDGGCICAWGWVPNNCGEPNMYMLPYRCKITNADPNAPHLQLPAQAPVWCEGDPSSCVQGPKQMVYWHQLEGNNIETDGSQADGQAKSPGYNAKLGFTPGPQIDIFAPATSAPSSTPMSDPSSSSTSDPSTPAPTVTGAPTTVTVTETETVTVTETIDTTQTPTPTPTDTGAPGTVTVTETDTVTVTVTQTVDATPTSQRRSNLARRR